MTVHGVRTNVFLSGVLWEDYENMNVYYSSRPLCFNVYTLYCIAAVLKDHGPIFSIFVSNFWRF